MKRKEQPRVTKDHERHLKRECEYYNQMLSYTAYRSHKIRYNESKNSKDKGINDTDQYVKKGNDTLSPINMDTRETDQAYDQSVNEFPQNYDDANQLGIASYVAIYLWLLHVILLMHYMKCI